MRSSPRINKEFGKKISELLDSRGLSLRGAWYKTGVHYNTIHTMRQGIVSRQDIVEQFAEGLGEDPTPLLTAAGYIQPPEQVVESDDIIVRMRIQGDLTPEKQERIMRYVREIIEEEDGLEDEEKEG